MTSIERTAYPRFRRVMTAQEFDVLSPVLRAGYLEDWVWNATPSGAPQGGVLTAPTQSRTSSLSGWFGGQQEGVGREAWYPSV